MNYKLDDLFKDSHGTMFMIVRLPLFHTRKDKKVVYDDEHYLLTRVPDVIDYKSKYDNSEVRFTLPTSRMTEEGIELNIRKGNWIKI